jgi:hypothetical protein
MNKNNLEHENKERITINELKMCEGFEDFNDKEAENLADFIYDLTNIFYDYALNKMED